jgi:hypothetical protein
MNGSHEIIVNIVVLVAFGQTLFIADVIGIETANNELFVFRDRKEWIIRAQIDTGTEQKEQAKKERELTQRSLLFCKAESSCKKN